MERENASLPVDSPVPPMQTLGAPMFLFALLAILLIGGGYAMLQRGPKPILDAEEQQFTGGEQPIDYRKWEKPTVVLALTGQMHGYIDPCGCSDPQYGGLVRRYNFIESLRAKGWNVAGIDLGELPSKKGIHKQNVLKYDLSMKALGTMEYRGVGIGEHELLLPLGDGLAYAYEKNPKVRALSITLAGILPKGIYYDLNARPYEIISLGKNLPKIGVLSMMGPNMREKFEKREKFLDNQTELPKALKAFADAGVEIGVILHHEQPNKEIAKLDPMTQDYRDKNEKLRKETALLCAKFCADERLRNPKIPPIQVMMILMDEPEPPGIMHRLDAKLPTQLIEIGHKGKYVGLLGLKRQSRRGEFSAQYQIVQMGPEWATPEDKKPNHPVIKLMQRYNEELRRQNMLAEYPRTPHYLQIPAQNAPGLKSTFVGSNACQECHPAAFAVHAKTPHGAKATKTLEDLKYPSLRNYDPECMKCHVTGFGNPGGYGDPIALADLAKWTPGYKADPKKVDFAAHNQEMRNVGCESCHGPGSEHIRKPGNKALRLLMNPYRPTDAERTLEEMLAKNPNDAKAKAAHQPLFQTRMQTMSRFCMSTCHDDENDVKWGTPGHDVVQKWIGQGLIHRTPKNNNGAPMVPVPPAAKAGDPPIVIEVVDEKKKK